MFVCISVRLALPAVCIMSPLSKSNNAIVGPNYCEPLWLGLNLFMLTQCCDHLISAGKKLDCILSHISCVRVVFSLHFHSMFQHNLEFDFIILGFFYCNYVWNISTVCRFFLQGTYIFIQYIYWQLPTYNLYGLL